MLGEVRRDDAVTEPYAARRRAGAARGSPRGASSCRFRSGRRAPPSRRARPPVPRPRAAACRPPRARSPRPRARPDLSAAAAGSRSRASFRRRVSDSSSPRALDRSFSSRPIWVSFACACFAFDFLYRNRATKRLEPLDVLRHALGRLLGRNRARGLLAPPLVPGPREVVRRARGELEHRGRHRLEEPAIVGNEDDGGVDRLELALEPFEALDVEVVRRLVEEEQVGPHRQRPRERRARELPAGEGA